ncbi:MAG TPA: arylamine N-acetyltransferase [Nocardioides sp.]|nr:arylamine N-acetyltransferase [Nocardioides sp.]
MLDEWQVADLDLGAYLARVGVEPKEPGVIALGELHEAHVRTFTFDNIDVLLDQHPGVSLPAIAGKFLGRGRGGYCFEHGSLFAAVLERLGYDVRRQLGRVETGDVMASRNHMTIGVRLGERWWLCDPGFGMGLIRPIPLEDGREADHYGWRSRVVAAPEVGGWTLEAERDGGWQALHTVDLLPVRYADVVAGHHFTSTFPSSLFRARLMVARYLPDRHVTLTHQTVTIRRAGRPTEHHQLRPDEIGAWLEELEVALTADESRRLHARVRELVAL